MTCINTQGGSIVRALFPKAEEVYLVGPFNGWSTVATPMKQREGKWETCLPLEAELESCFFFVWEAGQKLGRVFHAGQ